MKRTRSIIYIGINAMHRNKTDKTSEIYEELNKFNIRQSVKPKIYQMSVILKFIPCSCHFDIKFISLSCSYRAISHSCCNKRINEYYHALPMTQQEKIQIMIYLEMMEYIIQNQTRDSGIHPATSK